MKTLIDALQGSAARVVDQFYEELSRLPKSRRILEMLDGPELAHLKSRQVQNLLALATPRLSMKAHEELALRVGRIHAIVGLDKEELVRSRGILQKSVFDLIGERVTSRALSQYDRRLTTDLAYQLKAYQDIQDSQQRALQQITQVVWSDAGYTHFIDEVTSTLTQHDEIVACTIGRPDETGVFRFESATSRYALNSYLSMLASPESVPVVQADDPRGQGPVGRAWRSGKIERVINYRTDPTVLPWRDAAQRDGIRSSVAIPLSTTGQRPVAVLLLHSALPGGFVGPHQVGFVDMLQTLLGYAVGQIRDLESLRSAVPIEMRQHWAALARSDALTMHYQPLLDLHTGKAAKVEALARLADGERLLSPAQFLPALASDDLLDLFARGLGQSLADRNVWLAGGKDIGISINLPPAAFNDIRYFEATRAALGTHACPPDRLTLELLETEALSMNNGQRAILSKFKELGALVAQDDLGSGHSGLLRLREVPFDWIKIDRDVARINGKDALDALHLVYQLTRLGHSLGKHVVAEGIESLDLLHALETLGVDAIQGYVVAKPMPANEVPRWLDQPALAPEDPHAKRPLTRLARFVIWEERLFLIAEVPQAASVLARLVAAPPARRPRAAKTAHTTTLRDAGNGGGQAAAEDAPAEIVALAKSLTAFDDTQPANAQQVELQRKVIDSVLNGGRGSRPYKSARQKLINTIMGNPLLESAL